MSDSAIEHIPEVYGGQKSVKFEHGNPKDLQTEQLGATVGSEKDNKFMKKAFSLNLIEEVPQVSRNPSKLDDLTVNSFQNIEI